MDINSPSLEHEINLIVSFSQSRLTQTRTILICSVVHTFSSAADILASNVTT